MSFLRVSGTKIVDQDGNEVVLRGAGLGGWMNMENFISGYPGCEFQIRAALKETIGSDKADFFFDKFLEYFFQDADAAFFASLGLNCIRIPFNYHHFEDDLDPRVLKPEGFKHLDRVIDLCSRHGIYTILDLHTAPGGQSGGWHADSGVHLDLYDRVHDTIRQVDENHILFLDGNTFATDFSRFGTRHERWTNTAYSIHDYSVFGFPNSPEDYIGSDAQKARMRRGYEKKREWMDQRGLCVWNGEWGPVYARVQYEGDKTDGINKRRYHVLKDQLEIYNKGRLSWSIWLYKDIGF